MIDMIKSNLSEGWSGSQFYMEIREGLDHEMEPATGSFWGRAFQADRTGRAKKNGGMIGGG